MKNPGPSRRRRHGAYNRQTRPSASVGIRRTCINAHMWRIKSALQKELDAWAVSHNAEEQQLPVVQPDANAELVHRLVARVPHAVQGRLFAERQLTQDAAKNMSTDTPTDVPIDADGGEVGEGGGTCGGTISDGKIAATHESTKRKIKQKKTRPKELESSQVTSVRRP